MQRLVKVVMTIFLMIMVINVVNAQQGSRSGYQRSAGFDRGLNLSEDQQLQMKSMRLKMQQEMLPIRNKMGENRAKLRTLSTVENADMKAINKLIDANSQLIANMAKLKAANQQEIRKVLTEEQRIMFDSRDFDQGAKRLKTQKGQAGQRGTKQYKQGQGRGYGQQDK